MEKILVKAKEWLLIVLGGSAVILIVFSIPFSIYGFMWMFDWEWWKAGIAVILLTAIPFGFVGTYGMALAGVFGILAAVFVGHAPGIKWESLANEVTSLYQKGQYDRAVVVAKKALAVAEKAVAPNHLAVAASLSSLAAIYSAQGQYGQAEPLYKRALAACRRERGSLLSGPTFAPKLAEFRA